jgi:hypothetical protein
VTWQDIYFIFARYLARIFISKTNNYYFLTEKKGCDRFTPPLYQPTVHLRFEI